MAYVKHHGIELANGADIKNFVVEKLDTDPTVSAAGRVWFNTNSKTYKISTLNETGAVIVKSFHTLEEFNTFISNLNNTATGSTLVGYAGHTGSNSQFSVAPGSLKAALDTIADKIDSNTQSIVDIGTGNLVAMQNELDATQVGAGLANDGKYVVPTSSNYLNTTTTLAEADAALDIALKAEVDARVSAVNAEAAARTAADTAIVNDLASTVVNKGAALIGVADAGDKFTATTVEGVLAELQSNIETEISHLSLQAIYDTSVADAEGDAILKLTANKTIKFVDNDDGTTYFKIDPNDDNPLSVEMTGPVAITGDMMISGNLLVNGSTTEITSTVTSADHFALRPEGTVAAIAVEPGTTFSGTSVIDIKAANGGATVVAMGTDGVLNVNRIANATSASFSGQFHLGAEVVTDFGGVVVHNVAAGVANTDVVNVGQLNAAINSGNATQSELDVTQQAVGLAADGTYVVPTNANYLSETTTFAEADAVLDTTLFTAIVGSGLDVAGTYTADTSANYIATATSLFDADKKLDARVKALTDTVAANESALRSDINALKFAVQTTTPAATHTIVHNLNTPFVNYTVLTQGDDGKFRNDTVAVTEVDNNTLLVELFETRNIKVIAEKVANI